MARLPNAPAPIARSARWPLTTTLPAIVLLGVFALLTGCAGSHDTRVRAVPDDVVSTRGIPLEAARPRLEAARTLDSGVRLGFYEVPAPLAEGETDTAVADLMREVAPRTWSSPGREVYRDGPWLVAITSPEVQRSIATWAKERRAADIAARALVETEVRVMSFTDGAAPIVARLGLSSVGTEGGVLAYLVGPDQVDAFLEARGAEALSAPRLVSASGQRASISILNQQAYIEDYEVYQLEDAVIADPRIGILQEGLHLELVTTLEGDAIVVDTEVDICELLGMTTTEVEVDPSLDPVSLDLPEVRVQHLSAKARLAAGHALVLGPADTEKGGDRDAPWVIVIPRPVTAAH